MNRKKPSWGHLHNFVDQYPPPPSDLKGTPEMTTPTLVSRHHNQPRLTNNRFIKHTTVRRAKDQETDVTYLKTTPVKTKINRKSPTVEEVEVLYSVFSLRSLEWLQ